MKTLSSTLMPVALYTGSIMSITVIGIFITKWEDDKDTAAPIALIIFILFFLYLLYCFSKFRITKVDTTSYYLTNMLTWKTVKIENDKIIDLKKSRSIFDPLSSRLIYLDNSGRKQTAGFTRKFGII